MYNVREKSLKVTLVLYNEKTMTHLDVFNPMVGVLKWSSCLASQVDIQFNIKWQTAQYLFVQW